MGTVAINNTCLYCEKVLLTSLQDPSKVDLFPFMKNYYPNVENLNYSTCFGECSQGRKISMIDGALETCKTVPVRINNCSYACKGLSYLDSATSALAGLEIEFQRNNFLVDIMNKIFSTPVSIQKYEDHLEIQQFSSDLRLESFMSELVLAITPEIPNLKINMTNGTIGIYSHDNVTTVEIRSENTMAVVVSSVIGGVIGLTAILGLLYGYYRYNQTDLSVLPDLVAWSFRQYETSFFSRASWTYCGSGMNLSGSASSGFYYKKLTGADFDYVSNSILGNTEHIESITAIYNPMLLSNFINAYIVQRDRTKSDPKFFQRKTWINGPDKEEHQWVYDRYMERLAKINQSKDASTPIIGLWKMLLKLLFRYMNAY